VTTAPIIDDLASLVWPCEPAAFFGRHWGARHLAVHADAARLAGIAARVESWDIERLVRALDRPVLAWFETLEGEFRSMTVRPAEAIDVYRAGMTLYVQHVPSLDGLAHRLADDLGVPASRVGCSVFASRRGRGTRCHFDKNENFTLQISGAKTWRVAANAHVRAPVHNWVTGEAVSEQLPLYADEPMPQAIPATAETIELRPGSMLYVPRGHWHETVAGEDAVALNVSYSVVTWAELVLPAIRTCLVASERWRQAADGLWGRGPRRREAAARLADLLGGLADAVRGLELDDFVSDDADATEAEQFRVSRLASVATTPCDDGETVQVDLHRPLGVETSELEMASDLAAACRWLAARRGETVTAGELQLAVEALDSEQALDLLRALPPTGLVTPRRGPA